MKKFLIAIWLVMLLVVAVSADTANDIGVEFPNLSLGQEVKDACEITDENSLPYLARSESEKNRGS